MTDASAAVSSVSVSVVRSLPKTAGAIGVPVASKGAVPRQLGLNRAALEANGFEGKAGQTLAVPTASGLVVAVGVGAAHQTMSWLSMVTSSGASSRRSPSRHADPSW